MKWTIWMVLPVLAAGGCGQKKPDPAAAFFDTVDRGRTQRILNAQTSRGAREDGTLRNHHFDGAAVNALGRAKLEAMLHDARALPLVVWVDLSTGDTQAEQRRAAVRGQLAEAGLRPEQFRIEAGANPATYHPVADDLRKLQEARTAAPPQPTSSSADENAAAKQP